MIVEEILKRDLTSNERASFTMECDNDPDEEEYFFFTTIQNVKGRIVLIKKTYKDMSIRYEIEYHMSVDDGASWWYSFDLDRIKKIEIYDKMELKPKEILFEGGKINE